MTFSQSVIALHMSRVTKETVITENGHLSDTPYSEQKLKETDGEEKFELKRTNTPHSGHMGQKFAN